MFIVNEQDRVNKISGDYLVHNGLNKQDPERNPEKYIARVSHLKQNIVKALYRTKCILVGEAFTFEKNKEAYDILVFWYNDPDMPCNPPIFLDYVYGASQFCSAESAVSFNFDIIYKALLDKKIIFEV